MNDSTLNFQNRSGLIQGRVATFGLRKDGILHIDVQANELLDINDIKEMIEAARILGNGKKLYNLLTIGPNTTADDEARRYATTVEGNIYRYADAFVIHTLSQKIVANFYMKINKPLCPTRFFTDQDQALAWLQKLRSETQN